MADLCVNHSGRVGIHSNTSGRLRLHRTQIFFKIRLSFSGKEWILSLSDKGEEPTAHLENHGSKRFSIKIRETISGQLPISYTLHIPFSLPIETLSAALSNMGRMPSGLQGCTLIPPSPFTLCLALDRLIQSFMWLTLISPTYNCLKQSHQPSGTSAETI